MKAGRDRALTPLPLLASTYQLVAMNEDEVGKIDVQGWVEVFVRVNSTVNEIFPNMVRGIEAED